VADELVIDTATIYEGGLCLVGCSGYRLAEVAGRVEHQRTRTCQNVGLQSEEAHGRVHNEGARGLVNLA